MLSSSTDGQCGRWRSLAVSIAAVDVTPCGVDAAQGSSVLEGRSALKSVHAVLRLARSPRRLPRRRPEPNRQPFRTADQRPLSPGQLTVRGEPELPHGEDPERLLDLDAGERRSEAVVGGAGELRLRGVLRAEDQDRDQRPEARLSRDGALLRRPRDRRSGRPRRLRASGDQRIRAELAPTLVAQQPEHVLVAEKGEAHRRARPRIFAAARWAALRFRSCSAESASRKGSPSSAVGASYFAAISSLDMAS